MASRNIPQTLIYPPENLESILGLCEELKVMMNDKRDRDLATDVILLNMQATLANMKLLLNDLEISLMEEELAHEVEAKVVEVDEVDSKEVEIDSLTPEADSPPKLERSVPIDISEQVKAQPLVEATEVELGEDMQLGTVLKPCTDLQLGTAPFKVVAINDDATILMRPSAKPPYDLHPYLVNLDVTSSITSLFVHDNERVSSALHDVLESSWNLLGDAVLGILISQPINLDHPSFVGPQMLSADKEVDGRVGEDLEEKKNKTSDLVNTLRFERVLLSIYKERVSKSVFAYKDVVCRNNIIHGFGMNFYGSEAPCNVFIEMSMSCGCLECVQKMFDEMSEWDSVSLNGLVFGYLREGNVGIARHWFNEMDLFDSVVAQSPVSLVVLLDSSLTWVKGVIECSQEEEVFELIHITWQSTDIIILRLISQNMIKSYFLGQTHMEDKCMRETIRHYFFVGIDKVRLMKPVIVGDTLVMMMTLTKLQKHFGIAKMELFDYVEVTLVIGSTELLGTTKSSVDSYSAYVWIHDLSWWEKSLPFVAIVLVQLSFGTTWLEEIEKVTLALTEMKLDAICFLGSEPIVVYSYAMNFIEQLLFVKDEGGRPHYLPADIDPLLEPMLGSLFYAMKFDESKENPYVMKCVVHVLLRALIFRDVAGACIQELTSILSKQDQSLMPVFEEKLLLQKILTEDGIFKVSLMGMYMCFGYLVGKVHVCVGRTSVREGKYILSAGVHVLVGTPGCVFDMFRRHSLRTDYIKLLVLDENGDALPQYKATNAHEFKGSFEDQGDIQMKRLVDYFGWAFSGVSSTQFPWVKMFRDFSVAKMIDISVRQVSNVIYKTTSDWINKHDREALSSLALWSLDSIRSDFAMHQGQGKPPVIIWMIALACVGDLCVAFYAWVHNLVSYVGHKSCNPQSSVYTTTSVVLGCLTQRPDCYKLCEEIYEENLKASVVILRELRVACKHLYEKAVAREDDPVCIALYKGADKYHKVILGRTSREETGGDICGVTSNWHVTDYIKGWGCKDHASQLGEGEIHCLGCCCRNG